MMSEALFNLAEHKMKLKNRNLKRRNRETTLIARS